MVKRFLFALLGAAAVSAAFAEEPLLNHTGAVTALAFDGESGRIYSAGEDGFLKIWDTRSLDMTGSFSVSDVALTAAAVSKNADRMVLVERRGPSRFGVLLRSLKEQEPLARIFIESPVNRIAFSPSGGMVIVAQNRKDSLLFFDADTLQRIVLPFQVTEPVLDFYINDRETAFLAVTQSGTIFYYNLIDNKVIKTLRGPKNPQSPCILPGGNYLLTQSGTKLSLVSLATGKVINSAELPGKDARQIVPRTLGTVSYWSVSSRELIVYTWNYRKTGEIFMPSQMIRNPEPVSAVIEGGSGFCLGYQTGSVSVLGSDSRNVPISSVFVPEPISDIALAGGILYAATDRQIHSLSAASKAVAKVPPLNPLGRPVYLYAVGGDLLLLGAEDKGSRLVKIEGGSGFTLASAEFDVPVFSLLDNGSLLTVMTGDRRLRQLDRGTLATVREITPTVDRLLFVSQEEIFALTAEPGGKSQRLVKIRPDADAAERTPLTVPPAYRLFNPGNAARFTLMTREKSGGGEFFSFFDIDLTGAPYSKRLLWKTALPAARLNGIRLTDTFLTLVEKKQIGIPTDPDDAPSVIFTLSRPAAKAVEGETELYILNTDDTVTVCDKESLQPKGLMFVSQGTLQYFPAGEEPVSAPPQPTQNGQNAEQN